MPRRKYTNEQIEEAAEKIFNAGKSGRKNKLQSRKFWMAILTAITNVLILFGVDIDAETKRQAIIAIDGIIGLWIAVEGANDMAEIKNNKEAK
jgi:uncharacterized membrane protein